MYNFFINYKTIIMALLALTIEVNLINNVQADDQHKIVLLVNEEIITSHDIIQRMKIIAILNKIEINDTNSLKIQNQIIDELVDEKIQNEKINEYNINVSNDEIDDYELSYFNQSGRAKDEIYQIFDENKIDKEIVRNMISVQIAWTKLISGLYFRLISVSDIEIEQAMNFDSSISKEKAYNIIRDRQITLKANKYLRDLKDSSTIEYR